MRVSRAQRRSAMPSSSPCWRSVAWLWWRNVSRGADPPSAADAIALRDGRAGRGQSQRPGAARATAAPAGPLVVSSPGLAIPVAGVAPSQLTDTYTAEPGRREPGAQCHRHHGAARHSGRGGDRRHGRETVLFARRRRDHRLCPLARRPVAALLRPSRFLCAGPAGRATRPPRRSIGTVGISGNASPSGPHLHYAIYRMSPGERWWQGAPINPYPARLPGKRRTRLGGWPSAGLVRPSSFNL